MFKLSKSPDSSSDKQLDKHQDNQLTVESSNKQQKPAILSDIEVNKIVDDLIAQINQINCELEAKQQALIHKSVQRAGQNTIKNIEKYFAIEIDNQKVDLNSSSVQVFDITSHVSQSNTQNLHESSQDNKIMQSLETACGSGEMKTANTDDTPIFKVSNLIAPDTTDIDDKKKAQCIESCMPTLPKPNIHKEHQITPLDDDWCIAETTYIDPVPKDILKLNIADTPLKSSQLVEKISPPKRFKDNCKTIEPELSNVETIDVSKTDTKYKQTSQFTPPDSNTSVDKSKLVPDELFCLSQNKYIDYSIQRNVGKLKPYEQKKSDQSSSQHEVNKLNIVETEKGCGEQIQKLDIRKLIRRDKTIEEINTTARPTDNLDTTIDSVEDPDNVDYSAFPLDELSSIQINKLNIIRHVPVQDESHAQQHGREHSKKMTDDPHFDINRAEQLPQPNEIRQSLDHDVTANVELSSYTNVNEKNKVKSEVEDPTQLITVKPKSEISESSDIIDLEAGPETKDDKKQKKNLLEMSQNVTSYLRNSSNFQLLRKFNDSIATLKLLITSESLRLIIASKFIGLTLLLIAIFSNFWMANHINYEKSGITGISSTYIGLFGITRQDSCKLQDGANVTLSRHLINFNTISPPSSDKKPENNNSPMTYQPPKQVSSEELDPAVKPVSTTSEDGGHNVTDTGKGEFVKNGEVEVIQPNKSIDIGTVPEDTKLELSPEPGTMPQSGQVPPPIIDGAPVYAKESEFIERAGVFRDHRAIGNLSKPLAESRSELFGYPFYDIEIKGVDDLRFAGRLAFFLFMISIFILLITLPLVLIQYFPIYRFSTNFSRDSCIFLGYLTKFLWVSSLLLHLSGLLVMMIYTRSSTCVDELGRSVPSSFSSSFWLAVLSFIPFVAAYTFYTIKRNDKSPSNALARFCDNRSQLPLQANENETIYDIV